MIRQISIIVLMLSGCSAAFGQNSDRYIDQRSTAVDLITSYYNAINRHEYARAWDYWGGQNQDQTYAEFVAGFAETQSVRMQTGPGSSEGAAGSIYFVLPVVIEATGTGGDLQVYSGCYTLRLVQPAIQEPPFRPLHIEATTLNPRKGAFADIGPESCD